MYIGLVVIRNICPSCMAAIKDLGIRHIYYTTNDGYAYEEVENNRLEEII